MTLVFISCDSAEGLGASWPCLGSLMKLHSGGDPGRLPMWSFFLGFLMEWQAQDVLQRGTGGRKPQALAFTRHRFSHICWPSKSPGQPRCKGAEKQAPPLDGRNGSHMAKELALNKAPCPQECCDSYVDPDYCEQRTVCAILRLCSTCEHFIVRAKWPGAGGDRFYLHLIEETWIRNRSAGRD